MAVLLMSLDEPHASPAGAGFLDADQVGMHQAGLVCRSAAMQHEKCDLCQSGGGTSPENEISFTAEEMNMTTCKKRVLILTLAGASLGLLLPGCSSTPPVAEKFVSVKDGTVMVYQRKSDGSYGNYDDKVTWVTRAGIWQGQPVLTAISPEAGGQVYDSQTHGIVATLGRNGQPLMSYDPPIAYRWPMKVGDSWSTQYKVTLHATGKVVPLTVRYKVETYDKVSVPAGNFNAYLVVSIDSSGETQRIWIAPADSLSVVKRTLERPATHPQGAGRLEGVLLSRQLP